MPIFEYICSGCGESYEELIGPSLHEEDVSCPKCGSKKKTRKFSVFSGNSASASDEPALSSVSGSSGCSSCSATSCSTCAR